MGRIAIAAVVTATTIALSSLGFANTVPTSARQQKPAAKPAVATVARRAAAATITTNKPAPATAVAKNSGTTKSTERAGVKHVVRSARRAHAAKPVETQK